MASRHIKIDDPTMPLSKQPHKPVLTGGGQPDVPYTGQKGDVSEFDMNVGGGGSDNQPDPSKNLPMIVRDELQKEYPGTQITDQMVNFVVAQLNAKGMTAANTSAPKYRQAVSQFVSGTPWAQQQNPFGQGSQGGQLSPAVLAQMMKLSNDFTAPFAAETKAAGQAMSQLLAQALPNLPASMKGIVGAYEPIYTQLGNQMAAAIQGAQPGEIANAFGKYMQSPAAATSALSSLQGLAGLMGKST